MRRVVFVAIDIAAEPILLVIDLRLFFIRQVAAVLRAILARLSIHRRFLALQIGSLMRRKRTVLYTVRNPILLVFFALVNLLRLY